MEQHQKSGHPSSTGSSAGFAAAEYWEVSYLDGDSGRIRTETFDDEAAAERFACRRVRDDHEWAVVDVVRARQGRAAA